MSINKAILIGNLGGDPDVKVFNDGAKIATISLATSERWTDKRTGERKEHTEWHRVVFSHRLAEIAEQYLTKGSKVYVEGSIKTKKWTDKQGVDRTSTEIRAVSLQMLGGGQPTYPQPPQTPPPRKIGGGFKEMEAMGKAPKRGEQIRDEDVPF